MGNDTSAKIYSDQRSLPIHLGDSGDGFTLPFKEKWRAPPDAIAAVLGFVVTGSLVTANITNGGQRVPHPDPRRGDHGGCGVAAVEAARRPARRCAPAPTGGGKTCARRSSHRTALPPVKKGPAMSVPAPLRAIGNLRLTPPHGGLRRLSAFRTAVHLPLRRVAGPGGC